MQFCLAACTDKGKTRAVNQDALLLQQAVCGRRRYVLAAVCDGLGGLEKGELASSEVLRSLADWFQSRFPEVLMAGFPERELLGDWKNLVHTENERLRTYGEKQGIVLGTTLTAALFTEENWYCVHVGDSRLYEIAADTARQLTRDHSLAAEAVERGFMTREEGERDRRRSVLTRCIGACPETVAEYRAKLTARMEDVLQSTTIDPQRILTEAAIYADKVAVDEETVRLRSHVAQLRTMLESNEPMGRKMDFLIQEVNRESNTIGSKCNDVAIAQVVVGLKAEVEKMREQVHNIE